MHLIDRRDASLAIALVVGTFVVFEQPLRFLLSIAEDVSQTYHVDLVPGFVIFVLVFAVHHVRKQRDARLAMQLAAKNADEVARLAADMQAVVAASQEIMTALDLVQLRAQAWQQIPRIVGDRAVWIAVTTSEGWQWLMEPAHPTSAPILELAPRFLERTSAGDRHHEGSWLFPLVSSGVSVGLLGVGGAEPLTPLEEARIRALSAIVAGAIANVDTVQKLKDSSVCDVLTGCFNRAHAFVVIDAELRRSRRTGQPLSVVMFDIDDFKAINDQHGHMVGDALLAAVGATLKQNLRGSDVTCRYGGDEFLVILPDTRYEGAEHLAKYLRGAIERIEVLGRARTISCRTSVGVAAMLPDEIDSAALVTRSDEALYEDKERRHKLGSDARTAIPA
ncbi:MAG: hypothetical protein DMF90_15225 [Acidobacteria bacterium]|nr:MAG: hypothetical protein DMF90_15225 [Acidobacteriota bacterium]